MYLLQILYLFLPAGLANMAPPFASIVFPYLGFPVDFGKTFRGKRIFGDHKTVRGFVSGTIAGVLCIYLQRYLYTSSPFFRSISLLDYTQVPIAFGLFLAFGSLVGDAIKSFFKRQVGVEPGQAWFPWDQIDWIIGALIFAVPFIKITPVISFSFLLIGLLTHLLTKVIGFFLKINDTAI